MYFEVCVVPCHSATLLGRTTGFSVPSAGLLERVIWDH